MNCLWSRETNKSQISNPHNSKAESSKACLLEKHSVWTFDLVLVRFWSIQYATGLKLALMIYAEVLACCWQLKLILDTVHSNNKKLLQWNQNIHRKFSKHLCCIITLSVLNPFIVLPQIPHRLSLHKTYLSNTVHHCAYCNAEWALILLMLLVVMCLHAKHTC